MKKDYIVSVDKQVFWDYCSDFFDQDRLSDPIFHNKVTVHLLPNDKETWHLQVIINWRGSGTYTAKWDSFEKQIHSMGWILRNITEERVRVEADRKRRGLDGGVILEKKLITNPDYLLPHLYRIFREAGNEDGPIQDVRIDELKIPGGVQFLVGFGDFRQFGFVEVIKLNNNDSRVKIFQYQAISMDEEGNNFYQLGRDLMSLIASEVEKLYGTSGINKPLSINEGDDTEIVNIHDIKTNKDKELEIWERIPDNSWDRDAIKLWCDGHTNSEIGKTIHLAPRTITNRISYLRKLYSFIPTSKQVRMKKFYKNK